MKLLSNLENQRTDRRQIRKKLKRKTVIGFEALEGRVLLSGAGCPESPFDPTPFDPTQCTDTADTNGGGTQDGPTGNGGSSGGGSGGSGGGGSGGGGGGGSTGGGIERDEGLYGGSGCKQTIVDKRTGDVVSNPEWPKCLEEKSDEKGFLDRMIDKLKGILGGGQDSQDNPREGRTGDLSNAPLDSRFVDELFDSQDKEHEQVGVARGNQEDGSFAKPKTDITESAFFLSKSTLKKTTSRIGSLSCGPQIRPVYEPPHFGHLPGVSQNVGERLGIKWQTDADMDEGESWSIQKKWGCTTPVRSNNPGF